MTRVLLFSPIIAALVACVVGAGCNGQNAQGKKDGRSNITTAYVFLDRSDAKLEYAYVIGPQGVFAQVSDFPGYANRKFFLSAQLPGRLTEEAHKWQQESGELKPPLIPDGPLFSMTAIPPDRSKDGETSYFKDSNADIRKWLTALRSDIITDEHRVTEVPGWVADDARIKTRLGM
jgi:hypothetical protein